MPFLKTDKEGIKKSLKPYQAKIENFITSELFDKNNNSLQEAALYALQGPAKRLRPVIVLLVSELLGSKLNVLNAALSVELLHTASLIADDMPCMDNDSVRRDKPSLHVAFGQDCALLTSYSLIGEAYTQILKSKIQIQTLPDFDLRVFEAFSLLAQCNGFNGVPLGQFLDLRPTNLDHEKLKDIFYRKTALFFQTAFAFGWIFGGGDLKRLKLVKESGDDLGIAFQIYDDLKDYEEDFKTQIKASYPINFGVKESRAALKKHLETCSKNLTELGLYKGGLFELIQYLHAC